MKIYDEIKFRFIEYNNTSTFSYYLRAHYYTTNCHNRLVVAVAPFWPFRRLIKMRWRVIKNRLCTFPLWFYIYISIPHGLTLIIFHCNLPSASTFVALKSTCASAPRKVSWNSPKLDAEKGWRWDYTETLEKSPWKWRTGLRRGERFS